MSEDFKEVQDMLEQAKELVKTLENKYNELKDKPKNVRWRAEGKNRFFYVNMNSNQIVESEDCGWANMLYDIGNYFKTNEEAEKYKMKLYRDRFKEYEIIKSYGISGDVSLVKILGVDISPSVELLKDRNGDYHVLVTLGGGFGAGPVR